MCKVNILPAVLSPLPSPACNLHCKNKTCYFTRLVKKRYARRVLQPDHKFHSKKDGGRPLLNRVSPPGPTFSPPTLWNPGGLGRMLMAEVPMILQNRKETEDKGPMTPGAVSTLEPTECRAKQPFFLPFGGSSFFIHPCMYGVEEPHSTWSANKKK